MRCGMTTMSTGSAGPFGSHCTALIIDLRYARMPLCTSVVFSPCSSRAVRAKRRLARKFANGIAFGRVATRPKAMPFANFLANRLFALTARLLHGLKTTDVHSGMRAYRKSMINAVQWDPNGPALPVDMVVIPHRMGYLVVDVPIDYRERIGTTTLQRWNSTKWTFKRLWRARKVMSEK